MADPIIKKLTTQQELIECAEVIRTSYRTVAREFSLTREKAPTNPAFITDAAILSSFEKGIQFFGLIANSSLSGCIAIEKAGDELYYIERLAVLPEHRHQGYGRRLMEFSFSLIQSLKGKVISIGIINENTKLKNWYSEFGFLETGVKKFEHHPFTVCFMEKRL